MNGACIFFALQSASQPEALPAATSAISLQDALLILLTGAVLSLAKVIAALRARLEELVPPQSATAPAAKKETTGQPPSAVASREVSSEVLAVIAAAVHMSLEGNARIVAVTPETRDPIWSLEGRRQIFHSHQIR